VVDVRAPVGGPALTPSSIIDAMAAPAWWQQWFSRGDWAAWRALLAAAFALPPQDDAALDIYRECTGRSAWPTAPASEVWAICGRRGGKTRIMSTVAAWLAAFVDWQAYLAPGEVATVMLIAADRRQARIALRYIRSLFLQHPTLAQLVTRETGEALELSCRVVIEVTTASFRTSRGYTVAAVIADELAYWIGDEDGANPADEILDALRPAMATLPGAMLMVATSPYARRGPVWEAWRKHFGQDGDILVWKAPTRRMNPLVPQATIDIAMERDPARAAAEWGAEFRTDVESYVSREVVDAAVVTDRHELLRDKGITYHGFVDPSGGSADSMTLAIAHSVDGRAVLDAIREAKPPFSPDGIVKEFAELLRSYGINRVTGDHYAGEWPRERFRAHGIEYGLAAKPKSDLYRDLLPILNSKRAELLDEPRLISQLCALERRTSRGGRDSIDHPPNGHDDMVNAVAGAILLALPSVQFGGWGILEYYRREVEKLGGADAPDFGFTIGAKPPVQAQVRLRAPASISTVYGMSGAVYPVRDGIVTLPADDAKPLAMAGWQETEAP
jgi:hypothetical protein